MADLICPNTKTCGAYCNYFSNTEGKYDVIRWATEGRIGRYKCLVLEAMTTADKPSCLNLEILNKLERLTQK